ncbi:branched-chain amino acid aminotransferase [Thalassoporum mexicanum PCC 7367]|uniref:branched-chain amino acid transaminase n=1 Tax=Thalassoporum mexicanum TaxID=3457544 RepID=UPI00029FFD65|nr:branched-chain amino acid transaminase [Pseudanabaena sp. PCC 7367]AFY70065.1 branched-chain amino acid aminotransferase [Pseudanabaena sp. PCC 7367]
MSEQYAYLRGGFLPLNDATISVRTHAFLYGTAVFEGIKAYWLPEAGRMGVFRMAEHYKRLLQSAHILGLQPTLTAEQMGDLTVDLIKRNQCQGATYIRPIIYKSDLRIGPILTVDGTQDDFCLFTVPMDGYLDVEKGIHVGVSSWRRLDDNAIPARAKVNGAYVNTALAKTDGHKSGFADMIVLTNQGHVAEGSAMNLFLVRDGQLVTSAITENILEGITRSTIAELAEKELGIKTISRPIDRTELYIADEAFFVGTATEVAPIVKIEHRTVGDGNVGSITQKLKDLYSKATHGLLPKYGDWITQV